MISTKIGNAFKFAALLLSSPVDRMAPASLQPPSSAAALGAFLSMDPHKSSSWHQACSPKCVSSDRRTLW